MVYHRLESSASIDGPGARSRDDDSESGRSRSVRDESRYSRGPRSRDVRDDGRYSRARDKEKYYERYSDRPRYRDNYRYEDGPRYSDRPRYGDERRYEYGHRYPSDEGRYAGEGSRYRRGEDWGGRYRHEEAESSKHWRLEDEEPEEQPKEPSPPPVPEKEPLKNAFQNDGSFLEMFKKMQEQTKPASTAVEEPSTSPVPAEAAEVPPAPEPVSRRPPASITGKRRGGRVLPTGMVKKQKKEGEAPETPKDAWSLYMAEVRKYKEACCEEEGKTRPLVK